MLYFTFLVLENTISYVQDILLPTDSFASVSGMLFYRVFSFASVSGMFFFVFVALPSFSFSLYMYYSDLHCTV